METLNFDMKQGDSNRRLQLDELDKLYENAKIYKSKAKTFHDKYIIRKAFESNQKVFAV